MAPEQLYRAICIACHDADGRGTIVRKAMPLIPDLTDPKWQASHSDAEMIHTMLDPAVGTHLMLERPSVALDLPLRVLVWQEADGTVWAGYHDVPELARQHGIKDRGEIIEAMRKGLAASLGHATAPY